MVYKRLLQIFEEFNTIAKHHKFGQLKAQDKKEMTEFVELLDPLDFALKLWEGDGLTASKVYPGVSMFLSHYQVCVQNVG